MLVPKVCRDPKHSVHQMLRISLSVEVSRLVNAFFVAEKFARSYYIMSSIRPLRAPINLLLFAHSAVWIPKRSV
jgi:hypothetical protein